MSLLPQRKKSPGEIARLREELGIPGSLPGEHETPLPPPASVSTAQNPITRITPAPVPLDPKAILSLKRSERTIALPLDNLAPNAETPAPAPKPKPPKRVRSLRKSEQVPLEPSSPVNPPATSKLPSLRHNDKELNEIRRKEAIAMMTPVANQKLAAAHPALLIPGYLLALAGASCFHFQNFPLEATAACPAAALLIATFIILRHPISRHHAAFIAVIALFVIVFASLHFFPQLRHAT